MVFVASMPYRCNALQSIPVKLLRCWPIVLILMTGCSSILGLEETSDREVGQFDPLQNSLPDAPTMSQLCGSDVVAAAYYLSDTQAAVAYTWQKFQVHAQGAVAGGVTQAEKESAKLRHDAVFADIVTYKEAMSSFRLVAAEVYGPTSAECEQKVLLVVETIYQNYENTINVLQTQANSILESLQ